MELRARIRHFARPAALTVTLTALLVPAVAGPATADAAKRKKRYPVVTSVRPMNAKVGDTIVLRGRNFNRGKNKNTVVFKRDGKRAVFQKATLATARQIRVVVPDSVREFLPDNTTARFRLRVLSQRFSKSFTAAGKSPSITALPKPVTGGGTTVNGGTIVTPDAPAQGPAKNCKGDEDKDMLDASLENQLGLDPCNPDSDGDGVPDGYEYKSALDLNDDEYQQANQNLPYPGKRPYPNPLYKDADVDYDSDGLPMWAEYKLWNRYGSRPAGGVLTPNDYSYQLLYSDGEQYSLNTRDGSGRRVPSQPAATYTKANQFLAWAGANGYNPVMIGKPTQLHQWFDQTIRSSYDIRDTNLDGTVAPSEASLADIDDNGYISDGERDEDADGLSNVDELSSRMQPGYWAVCYKAIDETPYPVKYDGTDLTDPDTDGDGIRDGADDQDHDDLPNAMELSRSAASGGFKDWFKKPCNVDATLKNGPDTDGDGKPDWVVKHPDNAPVAPETEPTPQYGRVNPFNPCLPFVYSRTCTLSIELGTEVTPFDSSPWYALQ
jgi:IPT/TIG domain